MAVGAIEVATRPGPTGTPQTVIRTAAFEGPLALLLSLIEARQLDVLTVPLGDLAEAFLEALARQEGDPLPKLSDFVAVAAQLILIKSRTLLPRPPVAVPIVPDEAPDPEDELRRRLILYRAYRDAGSRLGARLAVGGLFHREVTVASASARAGARPADEPPLDPRLLTSALGELARLAEVPDLPVERLGLTITLEERADAIRAALRAAPLVVLQDLLRGVRDRVVAAVTFLAMLELVKQGELAVEQAEPWGPIVCRRPAVEGADPTSLDSRAAEKSA